MLVETSPHISFARESQHIGLLALFKEHPKAPAVAVDTIGDRPRRLHLRLQSPLEHLFGEFGLGAHPDLPRYPGPPATLLILGPLLGQIQLPVNEGLTPT